MHLNFALVFGSAIVGLLVGLTGTGGGALMTPMLVLFFGVTPSSAIASDLMAALFMKPAGVAIHWRRRTVNKPVMKYLCIGSVPAAFAGTYVMHLLGQSAAAEKTLEIVLGSALIIGSLAMLVRSMYIEKGVQGTDHVKARPLATVAVGAVGGFMVGLTSVGAGSLILVMLVMLYPSLRNDHLVGTDLAQSIPLTFAATAGALAFGHVDFSLTTSIIVGSVPMVIVGSLFSSRSNGFVLRRIIAGAVLLSGLKYVGVPIPALGVAAAVIAVVITVITVRHRRLLQARDVRAATELVAEPVEDVVALLPTRLDGNL